MNSFFLGRRIVAVLIAALLFIGGGSRTNAAEAKTLRVLFIGNSFTGRHNLSQVVKAMAEEGNPGLHFEVTTVIYGGRTLKDHWRLGSQNIVRLATLTAEEERATIASLEDTIARDAKDTFAVSAVARHRELLKSLSKPHPKWDVVVLQSYRDDVAGDASSYVEYAPKFAALIKAQGGRTVLYETTPDTQNAAPLTAAPDPAPILAKARTIAALARRIDASVVPMSLVALQCQMVRPDLTLRFVNDGHLNQTMAYLTACTFQAALFGRSAEGLRIDTVTDTRYLDATHRDQDRDRQPLRRMFSAQERVARPRIAWDGFQRFRKISE